MSHTAQETGFIADVLAELTNRRPDLAEQVVTTDAGLGLPTPAGAIMVARARTACVLGWGVIGPARHGLWPAAGDDVDGVVTEMLRRHDDAG